MSHIAFQPEPGAPRFSADEAIQYFAEGAKPKGAGKIGVELEVFLVDDKTLAMCSYPQVARFLKKLSDRYGWTPICEGEHIVGLERPGAIITLEPGGQLEMTTDPVVDLHGVRKMGDDFYAELKVVVQEEGLNCLSVGLHPTADFSKVQLVPKARYTVMAPRLEANGELARYMMRGTCAWQCALDYDCEKDFQRKFMTAYHVTTVLSAIFANSPWEGGELNGYVSKRLTVWLKTDPVRCGLIEAVYGGTFGFEDYYQYAAKVPLLFIIRGDQWMSVEGQNFADFLQHGYQGHYATREDWILHLTSLYPEIRLKQFIEFRGADANRLDWFTAFPALLTGIFQEPSLMEAARDLTRKMSFRERLEFHETVAKYGLQARYKKAYAYEMACDLIAIATEGLVRRGLNELDALEPMATYMRECHPISGSQFISNPTRSSLAPFLLLP